jgi:osmotically-inducible protein OsmY
MTTQALTGADVRLRDSVIRELDWEPEVDDSAIGVTAKDGVVTLTGFIDSYIGKLTAERVVKRVRGVRAVANDIIVRLKVDVTDTDIATAAALALKLRPGIPPKVQVAVHNGHVTLTGHVDWLHQKEQAEVTVRYIAGVRGVVNHIDVAPRTVQRDVRHRIVQSLHRTADLDARHIDVAVTGDVVTLTGTVSSWSQYEAAERGAGSAPGIRLVANRIRIVPQEPHEFEPPDEIC